MTNWLANFLVLALYLALAAVSAMRLRRGQTAGGAAKSALLGVGLIAVLLHAFVLYGGPQSGAGINLSLTAAAALVAWVVVCLYLLVSLWRPIDNLGVIVLPLAAAAVLLEWVHPSELTVPFTSRAQAIHIVVALVAYSLLALAAIQSVMLLLQENKLRHKQPGGILRALPSMQTTEETMFQMIGLGFALLTVTLVSGVFFSERVFGTPFKFTHHIVLAALGWIVYAWLLVGRWRFGWRGKTAVRWTLSGFGLLVLGYFGTKFVLEIILQR
ncbi:MAG: inner membrane protein YpjD [Sulfurifustaceae bacterium]